MKQWMLVVALVVMLAGPGVLHAAPLTQSSTLDQHNEPADPDGYGAAGSSKFGQTFTAGRTGLLDRIELEGIQGPYGGGRVDVQITTVNQDGEPASTALGSGSFDSSELPPLTDETIERWASVSIDPPVQVTSGIKYAIVVLQDSLYSFEWRQSELFQGNTYAKGEPFFYYDGAFHTVDPEDDFDFYFRTYVLSPPASTTPTCFGQTATIYVKDGKIVGGKDNGKTYKGKLRGTSGADVIVGTDGNDRIDGSDGNDLICGLGGNDTIHGNDGNDMIDGGSGNDTIYGDDGTDTLHGGDGDDRLFGGAGNDALYGDDGNDTLKGESGTDTFDGGAGTDKVTDYDPKKGETEVNIP